MCARLLEGVRTSRMVMVVICLFALMELTAALPQLNVVYPDNQNYSVVTLSCRDAASSSFFVQNAIYQRNGADLGTVVNVIDLTDEDVTFVFTQEQEGWFTCGPSTNNMSPSIGLAASPPPVIDTEIRYLVFPTVNDTRRIELSCAIGPGVLNSDRYSVRWTQVSPIFAVINDERSIISLDIDPDSTAQYLCKATIEHMTGIEVEYDGPLININKTLLATLDDGGLQDLSISRGEEAEFTCNFNKGDNAVTIKWKIYDVDHNCSEVAIETESVYNCSTGDSQSVLQVKNSSKLFIGDHSVQCILNQNIPKDFQEDDWFDKDLNSLTTRIATLTIMEGPPSSLVIVPTPTRSPSMPSTNPHTTTMELAIIAGTIVPFFIILCLAVLITIILCFIYYRYKHKSGRRISSSQERAVPPQEMEELYKMTNNVSRDSQQGTTVRQNVESYNPHNLSDRENESSEHQEEESHAQQPSSSKGTPHVRVQQLPPTSPILIQQELREKHMLFEKENLTLSKVIGQGESGLVYRGYIDRGAGRELVAVKTGKVTDKERLLKEVSIMLSFSHPNVMSLIGLCFDGEMPLLIMPFMTNGTVLEYVKQNRESLYFTQTTEEVEVARKTCLDMCYQIAKGMAYLTKYKFVHRDLAARNCMIDRDGRIKVTDFGLTEDMYGTNYYRQEKVAGENEERLPIRWMAPESIENNLYNESTDVWSFGVTCWEVFTCGGVPYAGIRAVSILNELRRGYRLDRPSNTTCSHNMWEMIMTCWCLSPEDRPKFTIIESYLFDLLDNDPHYMKLHNISAV